MKKLLRLYKFMIKLFNRKCSGVLTVIFHEGGIRKVNLSEDQEI